MGTADWSNPSRDRELGLALIKGLTPVASSVQALYFYMQLRLIFKDEFIRVGSLQSIQRQSADYSMNRRQTEMSSLSSLGHSTDNSEATKKSISTEEVSIESHQSFLTSHSSHHSLYVPFEINIRSLIKHLLMKLEEKGVLILHSDETHGEILIQKKAEKGCWSSLLDCLCLCKKQGWPMGSIAQSFEAVSIYIKREFVQYRCSIRIRTNCPKQKSSQNLNNFVEETLDFIRKCLESFKDSQEEAERIELSEESPLAMQISSYQKAYQLFISTANEEKRFKTLFNTSLSRIRNDLDTYIEEQQAVASNPVKNRNAKRISEVMEAIINETTKLFEFCQQQNLVMAPEFHPDYAIYAIEGLFCYNVFPQLFECYKKQMQTNCEEFIKNAEFINKNLSSKQYFDYLEVRPKFRLQSSSEPYDLAINALRELETALTLRETLLCMQKTFSLIKVCCLYEHDGKLDISSMDDILPVMIYVVARAQVADFPAYVKIIDDYVKIRGVFELEERVVTTLYVATEDISRKLPKLTPE